MWGCMHCRGQQMVPCWGKQPRSRLAACQRYHQLVGFVTCACRLVSAAARHGQKIDLLADA